MALDNQNIKDPSEQGVQGLKGLEGIKRLKEQGVDIDTSILGLSQDYRGTMSQINKTADPIQNIGFAGLGDSKHDSEITSASQLDNLSNSRGELQPWYEQIGAGLTKGVILAGTTFLDGTLGLIFGTAAGIKEKRVSALWDNDFSKALQSVNEWSEEALPNYYTDAEREQPWYTPDNLFSANFIGDKFIKNLGFTVGAFYSGNVAAGALKATKLPNLIGMISKSSLAPNIVTAGAGATISAINEGRIEALNGTKEWFDLHKLKVEDSYDKTLEALKVYEGTEMYPQLLQKAKEDYEATMIKLSEDRLKMGNADLLMNLPILLASNIIQFGRLYGNGFKTGRRANSIVGSAGNYTTQGSLNTVRARALLNPLSEGVEEISQKAAVVISGNHYGEDVLNFYNAKINPEAEQQTVDWIKSFAKGINETVNDASSWEEFFIGTLTGALGMPRFRGIHNKEGKLQSPVYLEGGIVGEYKEGKEQLEREQSIVNYMNDRVNSNKFLTYYQGLIRHNKLQNDMNQALVNNDEFEFKNAEHAQLLSDIMMFDNAGKLADLHTLINSAYNTSDENLQAIVDNTTNTITDDKGNTSTVGPFIDKNGNALHETEDGKKEMIAKLDKTKEEIFTAISEYAKIKNSIDSRTGQQFSDEQLEELTWLKSQINNWAERANILSKELHPHLSQLVGNMHTLLTATRTAKEKEGTKNINITEEYNQLDENERTLNQNIKLIEKLITMDGNSLAYMLSSNPDMLAGIYSVIEDDELGIENDDVIDFKVKIEDIIKLVNAANQFRTKFKEYLSTPNKLQENLITTTTTVADKQRNDKIKAFKNTLPNSGLQKDFRAALEKETDPEIIEETLKQLESEGNILAKNYREILSYFEDLKKAILNSTNDKEVKNNALILIQEHLKVAENMNEMADPNAHRIINSTVLQDNSLTDDENLAIAETARYAVAVAKNVVNNDIKFKDSFSAAYKELTVKLPPSKKSTGSSGVTETSGVKISETPIIITVPVGTISIEQIKEENESLNNEVAESQKSGEEDKGPKLYYRPAIPKFHIDASKKGDFRPFHVVVKEKNPSVNFDKIYNYLNDAGAFAYVDNGHLKEGAQLGFMIDPNFDDTTIFIIDMSSNQIVGSLDSSEYSVKKFEGLQDLRNKVLSEYEKFKATNNTANTNSKFIAQPKTKVSKIMVGKIPYIENEVNLKDIPSIKDKSTTPIFGIIKNGVLVTNNAIEDSLITKPKNLNDKEGRIYLLVKNSAGKYSPIAVKTKRFNSKEFDINDPEVQATPLYKQIMSIVDTFSLVSNEEDLARAVSKMSIYLFNRDLHIDFIGKGQNKGIRFTKVERDDKGKEVYIEQDGNKVRNEVSFSIYLNEKWEDDVLASYGEDNTLTTGPEERNIEDIKKEILEALYHFNLPFQISTGRINEQNYNNMLLNSNIMSSNIEDAKVLGGWFTTDYFDSEGNLQSADNPVKNIIPENTKSIVNGKESIALGINISIENEVMTTNVYVDNKAKKIYDVFHDDVTDTYTSEQQELLFDIAWAYELHKDKTFASNMVDNNIITPSGKVLNRTKGIYITGNEANIIKYKIQGNTGGNNTTQQVISEIEHNQLNVDKSKTDSEHYYIKEADGQYHPYKRVHTILGNNWGLSEKQIKALDSIKNKLTSLINSNENQYINYLTSLEKNFKIDLSEYKNKVSPGNNVIIINMIEKVYTTTSGSSNALMSGSAIDTIIRDFFNNNGKTKKPDLLSDTAYAELILSLQSIKHKLDAKKERFLANNIVLYHSYPDGTRIAGEVDILAIDDKGNFKIYDVKTSKYSFHDFTSKGRTVNYFINKSDAQTMSTKDYYTLQLSAYQNLFVSQYGIPITSLGILPFVLSYGKNSNNIASITQEKGILINYNEAVPVPLDNKKIKEKSKSKAEPVVKPVKESETKTATTVKKFFSTPVGNQILESGEDNALYNVTMTLQNGNTATEGDTLEATILPSYFSTAMDSQETVLTHFTIANDIRDYNKVDIIPATYRFNDKGEWVLLTKGIIKEKDSTTKKNSTIINPVLDPTVEQEKPKLISKSSNPVFTNTKMGYFVIDKVLYKGNIVFIENIAGYDIYGFETDLFEQKGGADVRSYYIVFPNGNTFLFVRTEPSLMSEKVFHKKVIDALNQNHSKVVEMSTAKTLIHDPEQSNIAKTVEDNSIALETESEQEDDNLSLPISEISVNHESNSLADNIVSREAELNGNPDLEEGFSLDDLPLRAVDEVRPIWNAEKEIAWLNKVLPHLSDNDKLKVVKGLIRVGKAGTKAWGMFDKGIVTLSDIAAEGTTYHEAFHVVFRLLMDNNEKHLLLQEAKERYGNQSELALEEAMAEGFREYIMSKDTQSLGTKILNFFRELYAKTTNWKYMKPSLISYYRAIDQGRYNKANFDTGNNKEMDDFFSDDTPASQLKSIDNSLQAGKIYGISKVKELFYKYNRNAEQKQLADRVFELAEKLDLKISFLHTDLGFNVGGRADGDVVKYARMATLERNKNRVSDVLLHEIIHSVTVSVMNAYQNNDLKNSKLIEAVESINEVYQNIKNNTIIKGEYGLKNEKELIAELANPSFRDKLKHINVWEKLKQAIKKIFFFDNSSDVTANRVLSHALDDIIDNYDMSVFETYARTKTINDEDWNFFKFNSNEEEIPASVDISKNEDLKQDLKNFFANFSISLNEVQEFDANEPLFNALDRIINFKSVEDLTDTAGYAIAFMMQWNPKMIELAQYKLVADSPTGAKNMRRSFKNRGDYSFNQPIDDKKYKSMNRTEILKAIGVDIAEQLKQMYGTKVKKAPASIFQQIWDVINEFLNMINPEVRAKFNITKNYTKHIAQAVKLGDYTIIKHTDMKPGTTEKAQLVDIEKALRDFPYEEGIISIMRDEGIALAGGASIASSGTLFRPSENPLHDLDFEANGKTKAEIETILKREFTHFEHVNTIGDVNGPTKKATETYIIMDRPFYEDKIPGDKFSNIYEKGTDKLLGTREHSNLELEPGVVGKMLDFFIRETDNDYPNHEKIYNDKLYIISDYRNAMVFKLDIQRDKDIFDYNNYSDRDIDGNVTPFTKLRNAEISRAKNKVKNAKIIWAHPAIGKTTYLERNDDIIEWDDLVNDKRNDFIRDQVDPNHKLDMKSKEYKVLRSQYMSNWKQEPEYIEFLTNEWNKLKAKAIKENKRIFASPAPLMELFENDFDIFITMPEKLFIERNMQRGGSYLQSVGWKQITDDFLSRTSTEKVIYTEKYFTDFMREMVGITWGTLTSEEIAMLELKGWTSELFNMVSQEEREQAVKCVSL